MSFLNDTIVLLFAFLALIGLCLYLLKWGANHSLNTQAHMGVPDNNVARNTLKVYDRSRMALNGVIAGIVALFVFVTFI